MSAIGAKLRKQRQSRRLTLAEIAASTKIQERYLAAIESGDDSELPASVFVKGYLRTYAESLGLDPASVLEEYERERGLPDDQPSDRAILERLAARQPAAITQTARTLRSVAIVCVVVILAAFGAWAWLRGRDDGRERGTTSTSPPSPTPAVASPAPPTATPEAPEQPGPPDVTLAPPPRSFEPESAPRESAQTPPPDISPPVEKEAPKSAPTPPPPAEPQVESETREPATASQLEVPEFGVGTGVVERRLVGSSDSFAMGTEVVFWTRVVGGRPGDVIRHVWSHEGRVIGIAELAIGGSHWRTHSRRTLEAGSRGAWVVEARDASGRVLARSSFTCE